MIIYEDSKELQTLNELFVDVKDSGIPSDVENSIYYPKLRHMLYNEIRNFCKEYIELRDDLDTLRMQVGAEMTENEIRTYLNGLMDKYNGMVNNVGLVYHIEANRFSYGVPVVVVIKRDTIYMKKFVFRFKKDQSAGTGNLTPEGMLKNSIIKALIPEEEDKNK